MPWYLYLALKQLFPSGRWFSFFTAISVLSVSLGVALLIVVLSVMGGFAYEIHEMIRDTQGDVAGARQRGDRQCGPLRGSGQGSGRLGVHGLRPGGSDG